nr:MAG TPA: Putative amidoligase enzyme [Caudoviricetes sp.]DAS81739.1 MAG TPA: Putative amidoligase enzyme [Caudoviricetes sp.]
MRIEFHRTGAERKALVTAIGEILEVRPKYKGMPSAAYEIDYYTVTKDGTLEFDDRTDSEEVENLLEQLADRGIVAAPAEMAQAWLNARAEELSKASETEPQEANVGLTVEIPLDKVSLGNLTKLLEAKGKLIRKALGISELSIEILEDRVAFPWFEELPNSDAVKAYTHFISALCEMSRNAKRVTATEKSVENEKYAFRCFLLRLGFIGSEYKAERKILLKNLTGSSAFKDGGVNHEVSE